MVIASFMPKGSFWIERLEKLAREFPDHEILVDPDRSLSEVGRADAILANRLDLSIYQKATSLKVVFVPFTGLNHLPVELLIERGVRAYNVHGNAESVAQCALALTLAFYGRLIEYHQDLRAEKWHGFWVGKGAEDEWTSIFRKSCTILGTGAIGTALARLLKAFDCTVIGYRRRGDAPVPSYFDRLESDLPRAIGAGKLVFVALPMTEATRGLVSKELLSSMKGKFLVNVGRGPIVDEEGLYLALKDGILKGAGIDTWYSYPQGGSVYGAPSRFPIHKLPNVVMTPHVGGSTPDGMSRGADQTIENIVEWLRTGRCSREADLRAMY